jgi:predicted GTPase
LIVKTDVASPAAVNGCRAQIRAINPTAEILLGASPTRIEPPLPLAGRSVVVVEDGPTVTHGGMPWGAGWQALQATAARIIDPRPWAAPRIAAAYAHYPQLGPVLPALGYSRAQLDDLRTTLTAVPADFIAVATPVDLANLLHLDKPCLRVRYEFAEVETPGLAGALDKVIERLLPA